MSKPLPRHAILIVNAKSRRGAEAFDEACAKLKAAGVELLDAVAVKNPKKMGPAIRKAIKSAPMVIVGGGDGSLSESIDDFVGTGTVFALLPLGTANSFARTMGIPLDLDGAIGVIAKGERRAIDLGRINDDFFLNNAAMGLAPVVAETVPHGLKRKLGRLGYLVWAGWSAASFNAFRLKVEAEGMVHRLWATEVRIANGGYFGGVELVEKAELDSGEMIVQIVTGRSSGNLAKSWFWNMLRLRHRDQWQAEIRSKKLRLETDPVMDVSIDGEIATKTPIMITVAPKAVAIAAPRESQP